MTDIFNGDLSTAVRRIEAMTRLCAPFSTEDLEQATSYEEILTTVVQERDELLNFAIACINDRAIWGKVHNYAKTKLSTTLLEKVLLTETA